MPYEIRQLHPLFAAEFIGADLTVDPTPELVEAVEDAMATYAVVAIRDAHITDAQQIRFSRAFGPLELPPTIGASRSPRTDRVAPEMYDVSNLDRDGNVIQQGGPVYKANAVFHTDSSFNDLPTKWSLLSGRQVPPEGGETQFIDTRAVWDQLPQAMKARAQGAVALHNFWKSRSEAGMSNITDEMRRAMPPARQPMVRTSASGRTALVIGSHAESIEGWPDDQARAFLREINAFAAQPPFVYTHRWRNGDLVIWDNRCTLHRAPEFSSKYVRDMRRTTINESGPERASTDPYPERAEGVPAGAAGV